MNLLKAPANGHVVIRIRVIVENDGPVCGGQQLPGAAYLLKLTIDNAELAIQVDRPRTIFRGQYTCQQSPMKHPSVLRGNPPLTPLGITSNHEPFKPKT